MIEQLRWLDPIFREIYSERLAGEEIRRREQIQRFVDAAMKPIRHDPSQNADYVVRDLIELARREIGVDAGAEREKALIAAWDPAD